MTPDQGFDLQVEASLENLHDVRDYIERTGQRLGARQEALGDLRLVVDEAVTNIVLHGYGGRGGPIELHMEGDGDAIVIRIRDRAPAFDADHVEAPHLEQALEDRPYGGMGIFLIRRMTDEAEFRPLPGGGNELKLVKRNAIESAG